MDRFAHPESFEDAWTELQQAVASWSAPALLERIKKASPLTKTLAYQTLEQVVTTLDTAVKTLKVSPEFTDEAERTRTFKRMLLPYHQLMAAWAQNMLPRRALPTQWSIPKYVSKIEEILQNLPDNHPAQLMASADFNVSAAVIGSNASFNYHFPQTLEDILMLEHQNLLAFISALNLQTLPGKTVDQSHLPTAFKEVLKGIEKAPGVMDYLRMVDLLPDILHYIKRIGIVIKEHEIIYRGNYTLRYHSGQVELIYDKKTQCMTMRAQFFGIPTEGRWEEIAEWVQFVHTMQNFSLVGPVDVTGSGLAFTLNVTPENIAKAMQEFFAIGRYTLTFCDVANSLMSPFLASNKRLKDAITAHCFENPVGRIEGKFIKEVILGHDSNYPRVNEISPEKIKYAAEKLLAISLDDSLALWLLDKALERSVINRVEIRKIIAPHLERLRQCETRRFYDFLDAF
jgi:hypothetical protein